MKGNMTRRTMVQIMWALIFVNVAMWAMSMAKVIPSNVSTGVSIVCFLVFCVFFLMGRKP